MQNISSPPPPNTHRVDVPLVYFPIFYKKCISWNSNRQAAICWLLLCEIISFAEAIALTWEKCAVCWHWFRHFRGYYCKSEYIWKNRTINQNDQNLIWIQSLGYASIHTAIQWQIYGSLSNPDQRTLVCLLENRGLNLTPCAPSRSPQNCFFFFRSSKEKWWGKERGWISEILSLWISR